MQGFTEKINRPVALVILDGWGYAPRTDGNAIAIAHTPNYDEICSRYPMTTLEAAGGNVEIGHLSMGTGRNAETEAARIATAIETDDFMNNAVINRAFAKARSTGSAVHLIGMLSDGGVHSTINSLLAFVRLAKSQGLQDVFIHCILDGLDVPPRTADIYAEALEIKLAEIGIGRIATLCGRFFAMDSAEHWERTARAYTMLVHAEGERTNDAVSAIRNSFLRGISDEFIAPLVVENPAGTPVAMVRDGDLVVFFNHRPDTMRQLVRSLCVPDGTTSGKPVIDTVCLTEYDAAFNLPAAFRREPERNALTGVLSAVGVPCIKITESARVPHLTFFFDGGAETQDRIDQQLFVSPQLAELHPESQSFKIADRFRSEIELTGGGLFVVNLPAADLMAASGDLEKTVAAIQYMDTCIGGICERTRDVGGVVLVTSTHGNCEEMIDAESGEPNPMSTANPVPFHYLDGSANGFRLAERGSLADVAPTVLGAMGIEPPPEMTGSDLRID